MVAPNPLFSMRKNVWGKTSRCCSSAVEGGVTFPRIYEHKDPVQLMFWDVLQKTKLPNSFLLQEYAMVWATLDMNLHSDPTEQLPGGTTWTGRPGTLHSSSDDTGAFEHEERTVLLFCWKPAVKTLSRLPQQPRDLMPLQTRMVNNCLLKGDGKRKGSCAQNL